MLLAVDVGNTDVVCGVFSAEQLRGKFRLDSCAGRSKAEISAMFAEGLQKSGIQGSEIGAVIVGSVVPHVGDACAEFAQSRLGRQPIVVSPSLNLGIVLNVDYPERVGADRIANSVAAKEFFGCPNIVVDFGTATTLDVIDASGAFCGGIIAPGLRISAEALFSRAALLPQIELAQPKRLIGKNTEEAMLSGAVYGHAAMVDGLLARVRIQLPQKPRVIATGGMSATIAAYCQGIDQLMPDLTLHGLRLLAESNGVNS